MLLKFRKMDAFALSNEFCVTDPEVLLIPFGEYEHQIGLQVLNTETAGEIRQAFAKQAEKPTFGGVPVYIGHPDIKVFQDKYKDTKAYGWIVDVRVTAEGLELRVKWSQEGLSLVNSAAYKFYSPHWLCVGKGYSGDGQRLCKPFYLKSVGLTNEPNIPVMPMANESKTGKENKNMNNLMKTILKLMGKENVEEEEAVSFVEGLANEAQKAEELSAANEAVAAKETELTAANEALQTKETELAAANEALEAKDAELTAANEALAGARKGHADLLIGGALTAGKITPAQKESWATKFGGDFAAAANELAALNNDAMNTESIVKDAAKRSASHASKQQQIIAAVNEQMDKTGKNWHECFMALQNDESHNGLFA